ncbi:hypothetical protein TCAL_07495 [Tigriopus californicus]|uniref:C2H2-type domain-containing protein n=1 Tax=Tigriopus californicus TaxID=6832 RepID=A0A553PT13_TIGCA|nr:transcriptional repressor CTCF-like [Tigriopus californicus]TRY80822.1 hypothetical protein TCAL_07495 [Tigriopus californicus]|eukprot:TCALIF_07495-PA protein Name:"Similar to CTCF Transcriptional repressor CTCF (Gallus gallus)" AED:0.09 eAED:0.09 QI:552/1/1/1/0.87/0.88/9/138/685
MATKTELPDPVDSATPMDQDDEDSGDGGGQYFVDQATGQYYYQSQDGETMTVVQAGDDDEGGPEITPIALPEEDSPKVGVKATSKASTSTAAKGRSEGQVVLNSGGDEFQTVHIVPSDAGGNEVSYVLIVQPQDGKGGGKGGAGGGQREDGGAEGGVYDFDADEPGDFDEDDFELEGKDKVAKTLVKRSQIVVQKHMCNYCNYTTPKRYLLSRHMKSHSEERPHKCSVCERGFKTLASLQNHVNTHTGTKPHRCKFCESCFTTSGELVRHVRYRHTHEKPHRCTECDYSSVELSKLKRHMRCHTGERPYQCPHCTYASPDTFKLKRHLRIHTGEKPYKCDICHARFTQSNSLKAHRLIHTGDKPVFQCELCPTTCGRKTDLRLHVQKLHTAEQPMHCKMCGKSFPDRYTLKVHKKTHEGEKCFKCDLCPYSSISQRHLESHMLIHTDQKPFQCDQCDQSFRQKQLLKRHQNLYHNPNYIPPMPKEKTHECPECARSFRHKGNLIRHMALHDPESTAQEKAIALKIGRQRKIQIVNGQAVEVFTCDDEDDEEEYEYEDEEDLDEPSPSADADAEGAPAAAKDSSGTMMSVQGQDGQHYVVLEVIQMAEGEEGAQGETVAIKSTPEIIDGGVSGEQLKSTESLLEARNAMPKAPAPTQGTSKQVDEKADVKKQDDVDNCLGFDEDDD